VAASQPSFDGPWLPGGGWRLIPGLGRTSVSELRRPADDSGAHPLTELLRPSSKIICENQKNIAGF